MDQHPRSAGAELIAAERQRQIEVEGYTAEHDAGQGEAIAYAGIAYALAAILDAGPKDEAVVWWPWSVEAWKPTGDRVRDLTKAGALIAAAIDAEMANRAGAPRPDGRLIVTIGPWDHEGAPHPSARDVAPHISVDVVWADAAHEHAIEVVDFDGCRAPVDPPPGFLGKAMERPAARPTTGILERALQADGWSLPGAEASNLRAEADGLRRVDGAAVDPSWSEWARDLTRATDPGLRDARRCRCPGSCGHK